MAPEKGSLVRFDDRWCRSGNVRLAGVDEAGRGSWAGPVVAAAVVLPAGWGPDDLDDSKRLSATQRSFLFQEISKSARAWSACAVSAADIDNLNILQATLLAMSRAVTRLRLQPQYVLVDGLQLPALPCPGRAIVGGDAKSAAVAAASVVAKVLRDRIMRAWDRIHPGYGFAEHKGYGSTRHREALVKLGPCPLHRCSYRPVAALRQGRLWHESR